MSNKIRISKKLSQTFPQAVASKIQAIGEDYGIKSFSLQVVDETKKFYVGEGERYTGIAADGKEASFEVVSENNIGAAGLSHRIGSQFGMPAGSYLINVWYYSGYGMTVYQISPKMVTKRS